MKNKIIVIAGLVFFILFLFNLTTVFYFYKQFNENINALSQQNRLTTIKVEDLERDSAGIRTGLETLDAEVKNYDKSLAAFEKRVRVTELNAEDLLSKVQGARVDIEDWQKKYGAALTQVSELADKAKAMSSDIATLKKNIGANVNLGRISVESSPAPQAPAQGVAPAAPPSAPSTSSVKTSTTQEVKKTTTVSNFVKPKSGT